VGKNTTSGNQSAAVTRSAGALHEAENASQV